MACSHYLTGDISTENLILFTLPQKALRYNIIFGIQYDSFITSPRYKMQHPQELGLPPCTGYQLPTLWALEGEGCWILQLTEDNVAEYNKLPPTFDHDEHLRNLKEMGGTWHTKDYPLAAKIIEYAHMEMESCPYVAKAVEIEAGDEKIARSDDCSKEGKSSAASDHKKRILKESGSITSGVR